MKTYNQTLPVKQFLICDDEGDYWLGEDNDHSFDNAKIILNRMRINNPDIEFTLYAEIDV